MSYEFLNPLRAIPGPKYSPHSRTMRTTWGQKIKDAFFILAGDHPFMDVSFFGYSLYKNAKEPHFGFIDWLFLGIPYALSWFVFEYTPGDIRWEWGYIAQDILFKGFLYLAQYVAAIISIPFHIIRLVLATILLIPAIFITGFVQAAVELFEGAGAGLTDLVKNLPITVDKSPMGKIGEAYAETKENLSNASKEVYNAAAHTFGGAKYDVTPHEKPKDPPTIGAYLAKYDLTLEDLTFVKAENPTVGEPQVVFSCARTGEKISYKPIFNSNLEGPAIFEKTPENKGNRAVFELNVGKSAEIMQSDQIKADIDQFLETGYLPGITEKAADLAERTSSFMSRLNPFSK